MPLLVDARTESTQIPCVTYSSKLTTKNQTTLPKAVVTLLGAKPSATLAYEVLEDGGILLSAKSATFQDIAKTFPKKRPNKPVSLEAMDMAVKSVAKRRGLESAR